MSDYGVFSIKKDPIKTTFDFLQNNIKRLDEEVQVFQLIFFVEIQSFSEHERPTSEYRLFKRPRSATPNRRPGHNYRWDAGFGRYKH